MKKRPLLSTELRRVAAAYERGILRGARTRLGALKRRPEYADVLDRPWTVFENNYAYADASTFFALKAAAVEDEERLAEQVWQVYTIGRSVGLYTAPHSCGFARTSVFGELGFRRGRYTAEEFELAVCLGVEMLRTGERVADWFAP